MIRLYDVNWDKIKVGDLVYSSIKYRLGVITSIKRKLNDQRVFITWSGGSTGNYRKETTTNCVLIGSSDLISIKQTPVVDISIGDLVCSSVRGGGHIATIETIDIDNDIMSIKYDCYDHPLTVLVSESDNLYYLGKPPVPTPELVS